MLMLLACTGANIVSSEFVGASIYKTFLLTQFRNDVFSGCGNDYGLLLTRISPVVFFLLLQQTTAHLLFAGVFPINSTLDPPTNRNRQLFLMFLIECSALTSRSNENGKDFNTQHE